MTLVFKITLLVAGILFAMVGTGDDGDGDKKITNVTGAFMMFTLLWLTLMTM